MVGATTVYWLNPYKLLTHEVSLDALLAQLTKTRATRCALAEGSFRSGPGVENCSDIMCAAPVEGAMGGRKRERENPCFICGHFHNYEGGEPCSVCGHAAAAEPAAAPPTQSAFPTAVVQDFLYLGSYDQASRVEVLKAMGITHILNVRLFTSLPTPHVLAMRPVSGHARGLRRCV